MNEQAQRIAIAEACGLKDVRPVIVKNVTKKGDDRFCGITSGKGWIPDYLNDLNAMHEAEKTLTYENAQQAIYCHELFRVIHRSSNGNGVGEFDKINATAAQRAEAFLRTVGKWVEE